MKNVFIFFFVFIVSIEHCESIAKLRHKLQHISKRKILFLDKTSLRLNEASTSTLVAPGETQYVIVEDNTNYSKRFDMIACCSGSQTFPPIIYTPKERTDAGVKGINKKMLHQYIEDILAQAIASTDEYPMHMVLD